MGLASLPEGVSWSQITGVALLGGIGFTMSLFITELAFEAGPHANEARVGILVGSVFAGLLGYLILRKVLPPPGVGRALDDGHTH
jgi:NhaA family Na+:H+ antiporter